MIQLQTCSRTFNTAQHRPSKEVDATRACRSIKASELIETVGDPAGAIAFPTVRLYHASKWGLEGFSQSLADEAAGFGTKVTIVEPGGYSTDWGAASAHHSASMPLYDGAG